LNTLADLPYRPCVGIMLLNSDGLVFVGQRLDMIEPAWQMPQGGIDPGESPQEAALRELEEEAGTNNAEIIGERDDWLNYDLPDALLGTAWNGKYRGQTQRWFAMRFAGTDSDINIETEHPEFGVWRWLPMSDLVASIVPFKRAIYQQVVDGFRHLAE
jgi:putative (di)nucleoside polyphosphate hydrolase